MMNRRHFLKTSVAASAVAGCASLTEVNATDGGSPAGPRHFLEWRKFGAESEAQKRLISNTLAQAALPAWNRLGIKPVGVFYPQDATQDHSVYLLLPFRSLEQFATHHAELAEDSVFLDAASDYLNTSKANPAYRRIESQLMIAFEGMPGVAIPRTGERLFELRVYESHNEKKAKLKVEMFNQGELDVFRKTGLDAVFFGESLIGTNLPNLTYMLAYTDMQERARVWKAFLEHPEWEALKTMEKYRDTVSHITVTYLVPAPFSQI